jgi:predicted nucleic acid-binding Zn ribbon protein
MDYKHDEDDLDDREAPDPSDIDDDSADTDPCPHCGKPVYEQAEICPHCQSYISREHSLPRRKPIWIISAAIITLLIVVCWVLLRL